MISTVTISTTTTTTARQGSDEESPNHEKGLSHLVSESTGFTIVVARDKPTKLSTTRYPRGDNPRILNTVPPLRLLSAPPLQRWGTVLTTGFRKPTSPRRTRIAAMQMILCLLLCWTAHVSLAFQGHRHLALNRGGRNQTAFLFAAKRFLETLPKSDHMTPRQLQVTSPIPTPVPTSRPTNSPTISQHPSVSVAPSLSPSVSVAPSLSPSISPQPSVSLAPSHPPSHSPTDFPSVSVQPSIDPSVQDRSTVPSNLLVSAQPTRLSNTPSVASVPPSLLGSSHSIVHNPTVDTTAATTNLPTARPSPIAVPIVPLPTGSPSARRTGLPSVQPSMQPSESIEPTNSPSVEPTILLWHTEEEPTMRPSRRPVPAPSINPPTSSGTATPILFPTVEIRQPNPSTPVPSRQPSSVPSAHPSDVPSSIPSRAPSPRPTPRPSAAPTLAPTSRPTVNPTSRPTQFPTRNPTSSPTLPPTLQPTNRPSEEPSSRPSPEPSSMPSPEPTQSPTRNPTGTPSASPTVFPTAQPSAQPSGQPSSAPSSQPSLEPSAMPSSAPSISFAPTISMMPSAVPTPVYEFERLILESRGVTITLRYFDDRRNLQNTDTRRSVACTAAWAVFVQDRIRAEISQVIRVYETIVVAVYNTAQSNNRQLQQVVLTFDVEIAIRSPIRQHNIRRYIMGPFDSPEEQDELIEFLESTSCPAFQSILSVQVNVPRELPLPVSKTEKIMEGNIIAGISVAVTAVFLLIATFIIFRIRNRQKLSQMLREEDDMPLRYAMKNDHDYMSEIGFNTINNVSSLGDPIPNGLILSLPDTSTLDAKSVDYDFQAAFESHLSSVHSDPDEDNSTIRSNIQPLFPADDDTLGAQYVAEETFDVIAPPGMLGLILETRDDGIPMVNQIKSSSVLCGQVEVGDRLVAVDDQDVTIMLAGQVSRLIAAMKDKPERKLTLMRPAGPPCSADSIES